MTLLEIERLIRTMEGLLKTGGNPTLDLKTATDYAEICHGTNVRLRQCEAMIKAGDRQQAIQLAEVKPILLDLVTILESPTADEWRKMCEQEHLPVAEPIDPSCVQLLSACYGEGISSDDPLYKDYRAAVLQRDNGRALKVLQSITRLNPTDENAASELDRLDGLVLEARLDELADLINAGVAERIVAAVESIEAFGFKKRLEGKIWCDAQIVRCRCLQEEAERLKGLGKWMETMVFLEAIRRFQTELHLKFDSIDEGGLEALEAWTRREQERNRKESEFQALLSQLRSKVQQSEEKDTSVRYVKLPELREDYEALHKVWRALEDFNRPVPEAATAAFRKRCALLEAEMTRRGSVRQRIILTSGTITVIVATLVVWIVLGRMKAQDFTAQLQAAVSARQVRTAEGLMDRIRTKEPGLSSAGSLSTAMANAQTFVTQEHGLVAIFQESFTKLPTQFDGEPDTARLNALADQVAHTRRTLDALAPDLKNENQPQIQAFEKKWQQFLMKGGLAVNQVFEEWVDTAEKQGGRLDYNAKIETTITQLVTLSNLMQKIQQYEATFTNHVSLRTDLIQRAAVTRAKVGAYNREVGKRNEGLEALKKAATFDEFVSAIRGIAVIEFSNESAAVAANQAQSLGVMDDGVLRPLLGATDANTWAAIKKEASRAFIPEMVMPAEKAFFQRLTADPAINANHQHYRFWLDPANTEQFTTVDLLNNSQGWKQIKAWRMGGTETVVKFVDLDYGMFNGRWKLLGGGPSLHNVEHISDLRQASAFRLIGLEKVWSGGTSYSESMLKILDAVKNSSQGSPLFRAYLLCQFVEMMELQPDGWGLSFCPSARVHVEQIRGVVGGQIESGDWFLPSKENKWSPDLDRLSTAQKLVSYEKQAVGNRLLRQLIAKDGLRYAGFMGLDGRPIVAINPPPSELWGYDAASKKPMLISSATMPFSPLFAFPLSRAAYLAKAGVSVGDPSFVGTLLPLFSATSKP